MTFVLRLITFISLTCCLPTWAYNYGQDITTQFTTDFRQTFLRGKIGFSGGRYERINDYGGRMIGATLKTAYITKITIGSYEGGNSAYYFFYKDPQTSRESFIVMNARDKRNIAHGFKAGKKISPPPIDLLASQRIARPAPRDNKQPSTPTTNHQDLATPLAMGYVSSNFSSPITSVKAVKKTKSKEKLLASADQDSFEITLQSGRQFRLSRNELRESYLRFKERQQKLSRTGTQAPSSGAM